MPNNLYIKSSRNFVGGNKLDIKDLSCEGVNWSEFWGVLKMACVNPVRALKVP
jgi:hypothetical protein